MSVSLGRSEALDLFNKWLSEGTLIRCDFTFAWFAAAFRVRVKAVAEDGLKLLSDDGRTELALALPADVVFRYGDSRADPAVSELVGVLCMSRPAPLEDDFRDVICLSEVTEPS